MAPFPFYDEHAYTCLKIFLQKLKIGQITPVLDEPVDWLVGPLVAEEFEIAASVFLDLWFKKNLSFQHTFLLIGVSSALYLSFGMMKNCVCFKSFKQWQFIKTNSFFLFIKLYTYSPCPSWVYIWKDKLVKQEKQGSLIHSYHFALTSVLNFL